MNSFEYSYVIRRRLGDLARSLSTEQLNKIPEGCNNNIAWHIGHLAVSTELLCYLRSGVQPGRIVLQADQYKNGTKPEAPVSAEEIAQLAERLISSIDTIRQDYEQGVFDTVQPFTTLTFGVEMRTIDEVLEFCALHDALHYGMVLTMRKLV